MEEMQAPRPRSPLKSKRSTLTLFLVSYLCAVAVFTAVVKGVLVLHADTALAALKASEAAKVEIASSILDRRFEMAASDLRALAHTPTIESLLARDDASSRQNVARLFSAFSGEKKLYDQVRYLDASGMEVVRVNLQDGLPVATPEAQLQDKSGRYFFQDTMRLQMGEVYASPLDLNVENNRIETPYKPMIRLGTPVFDAGGERKGIVLLNLYGNSLIDRFRQVMGADYPAMLLNRDGDWLAAPDPELEWGFMFGRAGGFVRRYPTAWQVMAATPRGSWLGEEGLYTYATVFPLQPRQRSTTGSALPVGRSGHDVKEADYFWKVVSLVPPGALPSADISRDPLSLSVYTGGLLLLLVLSGYLSLVVTARRRLRQELLRSALRHKEITDNLGEGLAVLDGNGLVTEVNPEAERLLGWNRRELLAQDAHALFHHHPEHGVPAEQCPIRRVAATGEVYRSEEELFCRKDGATLPVGVSAAPLTCEEAIVGTVVVFRDISERKRYQESIRHLAYHDTLTGLPNRRLLIERLELALALAQRHRRCLALMFLDLDHFKRINDTYGHDGGDELLKGVAARLCWAVRDADTVTRQGGDEFVILLPEIAAPEDAELVARRILQALHEPVSVKGELLAVGVSIGIAFYPGDADTVDQLLLEADAAMYEAKQAGRNRYCLRGMAALSL